MFRLFSNRYTGPGEGEKRRDRERPRTSGNQAMGGPEQGSRLYFADVTNPRSNYVCDAGFCELNRMSYVVNILLNAHYPNQHQTFLNPTPSCLNVDVLLHFSTAGYAPVTVITFLDKLKSEEDKGKAFDMASRLIGSSSERTFFISNYTHGSNDTSMTMERTALDILDFSLLSAERFIRIKKQREKNQMEREIAAGGNFLGGGSSRPLFLPFVFTTIFFVKEQLSGVVTKLFEIFFNRISH